ncbi:hypothetical protein AWB67_06350 [Caballeronia terrestris]|uniref:Lipoprotein n=1 Tax=Caballeronia terrestris TaxID=1226301 RepID=A0A158KQH0_9BURK|nr:hypothetical protein AWB67_06350 [Caballeronia terrestris]
MSLAMLRSLLPRAVIIVALIQSSSISSAAAPVDSMVAKEEICMPEGSYPMDGGGTTVFSLQNCFSRPVRDTDPWEIRIPRAKKSPRDAFNGARVSRYDYHDALYHCVKRHMRLPTVEELTALFVYANRDRSTTKASKYAIVAPRNDARHPGGFYGWGGSSKYWSHTFAGNRKHKVVDLSDGRVSIDHDPQRAYVSCVH